MPCLDDRLVVLEHNLYKIFVKRIDDRCAKDGYPAVWSVRDAVESEDVGNVVVVSEFQWCIRVDE